LEVNPNTLKEKVIGGFRTETISPTRIIREGLAGASFTVTRFFLHSSNAMVRVLKIRVAHSHLSIRISTYLLLN
jgi:hypothetical protein